MAIDPADLTCDTQDARWAAAFGRWGHHESARTTAYESWQLYCRSCLDKERQRSVANYEFEYVLLDPARQRRPDPDHHDDDIPEWEPPYADFGPTYNAPAP